MFARFSPGLPVCIQRGAVFKIYCQTLISIDLATKESIPVGCSIYI